MCLYLSFNVFANETDDRSAAFLAEGNLEAALADATKSVEISPDFAKGHARRGLILLDLGRAGKEEKVEMKTGYFDQQRQHAL